MTALTALAVDAAAGEPPSRLHPVVWMGSLLRAGRRGSRRRSPLEAFAEGAALLAAGGALAWGAAALADRVVSRGPASAVARGAALKPALALRGLLSASVEVEQALRGGDLPEARRLLAWHLVSRDTAELTGDEVAGAVIASLAENLSDAVVAPLLAFRAGGLPAAYLHRWINTADAVLGYRTPELEWFGKAAARADDLANWIPARVTALCIATAAAMLSLDGRAAARTALRDARLTPSPNGGWPMAAAAGALGLRLEKRGVYTLNPAGRGAEPDDIARCRRLMVAGAALAVALVEAV